LFEFVLVLIMFIIIVGWSWCCKGGTSAWNKAVDTWSGFRR